VIGFKRRNPIRGIESSLTNIMASGFSQQHGDSKGEIPLGELKVMLHHQEKSFQRIFFTTFRGYDSKGEIPLGELKVMFVKLKHSRPPFNKASDSKGEIPLGELKVKVIELAYPTSQTLQGFKRRNPIRGIES
jgi:hypothetical protein